MAEDIIIRILTAYQKGGLEEAKKSLNDYKRDAQDLGRTSEDLTRKTQGTSREFNNAQRALSGLRGASQVAHGNFLGLSQVFELLGQRIAAVAGKMTVLAGSFSAGYALGTAIDKWLGISKAVADAYAPMEKVSSIQDRIKAQLGDLNAVTLAGIKKEFDGLTQTLSATLSQMDQVNRVKNQLMGAETEAQLAEIEATMPPGPARDRAILQKRREREQAAIEERRAQARAKFQTAEQALAGGQTALSAAEEAEGVARKETLLLGRADSGATIEQRSAARQRLQSAEIGTAEARRRMDLLADAFGQALMEKANTMRGLAIEERTGAARFSAGSAAVTAREQEEARQTAARRLARREQTQIEMLAISQGATRVAMSSEIEGLGERAEELRSTAMPAARVADLRAKAAGTYKQAESSVAAVAAVLDSINAKMKLLEDKIKNLPR